MLKVKWVGVAFRWLDEKTYLECEQAYLHCRRLRRLHVKFHSILVYDDDQRTQMSHYKWVPTP